MEKIICCFIVVFGSCSSWAQADTVVRVCPSCGVSTLQEAIERAPTGGIVVVSPGVYREHDVVVVKPLTIRAEPSGERAILDLEKAGSGFLVKADDVEIDGFVIRNSGFKHTEEIAGIKVSKAQRCRIKNNKLERNAFGIYLAESSSCLILNNQIDGTNHSESQSGNGIHIWNGDGMILEGNQVAGNRDGIYFEFVKNSSVRRNFSSDNLRYGLHFMYSHYNDYRENTFSDNESGVAVMYSRGVEMVRNRFEKSHGPSSYGVLLKEISDSHINANVFQDNTVGIFLDGVTLTAFEGNLFKGNGWALRILGDSDSNRFLRNDFLGNTFDISTNAGSNRNMFSNNYWSRYQGLDLDKNGIGDEEFRPVRLSSMLVQSYDVSILLIHSLFFSILDHIESAIPVLTPKTFKDTQPLMRRATIL